MLNNMICIHLKRYKNIDDINKLLKENNLLFLSAEKLLKCLNDGYLKLFFDKKNLDLIAYTHLESKKKIIFTDAFLIYMNNMNSIGLNSKREIKKTDFKNIKLTIDDILDKINLSGIESLSELEKGILNNN
jgi:hypothetical protein